LHYSFSKIFFFDITQLRENNSEKLFDKSIIFAIAAYKNSFFITDTGKLYACGSVKKGLLIMDPKNENLIKRKKQIVLSTNLGFYNQNEEGGINGYDTTSGGQSKINNKSVSMM
jgi:hypothetical protein